jgi:hypothetical protein
MKHYKIFLPISALVFFILVMIICVTKFPGYQWVVSLSAVSVIVLSCLTFSKMVSADRSLDSRLTNFLIETRSITQDERIETLLNQNPSRERVEELINRLREKVASYETVKEEPPPKEPLQEYSESRFTRVLRDNYPL